MLMSPPIPSQHGPPVSESIETATRVAGDTGGGAAEHQGADAAAPTRTPGEVAKHELSTERLPPLRAFLLLRYTLIVATAYLLLVEEGLSLPPITAMLLVVLALASNVLVASLPGRLTSSLYFGPAVI